MKQFNPNRREFLKKVTLTSAAITVSGYAGTAGSKCTSPYDAKGLATIKFGKTGVVVPRIAFGCGSRFMVIEPDIGLELLNTALDQGLYFWDTAANYGSGVRKEYSEERLGRILKTRRKEVFLSTKALERDGEGIKRTVETSLKRLQTDYIDVCKIHSLATMDDVDAIGKKGAALDALGKLKEEGVIRYIGFTGHTSSAVMREAARRYDFDTMLIAINKYVRGDNPGGQTYEEDSIPMADSRGLGVMAMKLIRAHESGVNMDPARLIRYGLTMPGVDVVNVGMDSMEVLEKNVALLKNFTALSRAEFQEVHQSMSGFYASTSLPWMQGAYQDGVLV